MNQQKTELETKESVFILNPTGVFISPDIKQDDYVFDFVDAVHLTESATIEAPTSSNEGNDKGRKTKAQVIAQAIEKRTPIYLSHGSSIYLVQEPKFDSITNTICGRFVKTTATHVQPNITLFLKSKAALSIQDGCIPLEYIGGHSDGKVRKARTPEQNKKKTNYIAMAFVTGIVVFVIGLIMFSVADAITNPQAKSAYLSGFIPAFIFLSVIFSLFLVLAIAT